MRGLVVSAPVASVAPLSSLEQPIAMIPGTPPEIPTTPPELPRVQFPPVPTVYEKASPQVEYRVLVRSSLESTTLETDLNTLGREGWYLVQILVHEGQVLLVLLRPGRSKKQH